MIEICVKDVQVGLIRLSHLSGIVEGGLGGRGKVDACNNGLEGGLLLCAHEENWNRAFSDESGGSGADSVVVSGTIVAIATKNEKVTMETLCKPFYFLEGVSDENVEVERWREIEGFQSEMTKRGFCQLLELFDCEELFVEGVLEEFDIDDVHQIESRLPAISNMTSFSQGCF